MSKEFYAAFITNTHYEPGDERSRTYPGHGFGGGHVVTTTIREFKDRSEMERWVLDNHRSANFKIVRCVPVDVKVNISFEEGTSK